MMSALILLACSMLQVTPAPAVAIVPARDLEADRKAATLALEQIIKSYRDELGVTAQLEVTVSAVDGTGAAGAAPSIKMKCVFGSGRRALLSLRDYQLRLDGGRIVATHDSNPLAYLDVSDQGSPYYALFNAFRSLPFPELALALGVNLIEWTFDPLELKNAFFNIERLGAVVRRYVLNQYGATSSQLHAGLPTDRCVAEWHLDQTKTPVDIVARVEVPNVGARTVEVQSRISQAFLEHFRAGRTVVGFERGETHGAYLLADQDGLV